MRWEGPEDSSVSSRARWIGDMWNWREGHGIGRGFLRAGVRDMCLRAI